MSASPWRGSAETVSRSALQKTFFSYPIRGRFLADGTRKYTKPPGPTRLSQGEYAQTDAEPLESWHREGISKTNYSWRHVQ